MVILLSNKTKWLFYLVILTLGVRNPILLLLIILPKLPQNSKELKELKIALKKYLTGESGAKKVISSIKTRNDFGFYPKLNLYFNSSLPKPLRFELRHLPKHIFYQQAKLFGFGG